MTLEELIRRRDAAPLTMARTFHRTKRGPGRSGRDSRHSRGALTLRARLSKLIRGRRRARASK